MARLTAMLMEGRINKRGPLRQTSDMSCFLFVLRIVISFVLQSENVGTAFYVIACSETYADGKAISGVSSSSSRMTE